MAEIIIDIDKESNTSVEVKGVKGKQCLEMTADFEREIGSVVGRTPIKEMKEVELERNKNNSRLRQ